MHFKHHFFFLKCGKCSGPDPPPPNVEFSTFFFFLRVPLLNIKIILDCKLNQTASKLRVIRTVRGLVTLDECREHCIDAEKCSYFKFKVAYLHFSINFFCCWDHLTSQDHHDVYRRKCTLIQMVVKIRQGWVSGPKFCGRDGRYHRKF